MDTQSLNNIGCGVDTPKKTLTDEIIKKALKLKTWEFKSYSDGLVILGISIFLIVLASGAGFIFLPFGVFKLIKAAYIDILKTIGKFYILEKPCINAQALEYEDGTKGYRLVFPNKKNKKPIYVMVDEAAYNDIELNEECYVVGVKGLKNPCLFYRKREWTR